MGFQFLAVNDRHPFRLMPFPLPLTCSGVRILVGFKSL